jgi:hypothetical protein
MKTFGEEAAEFLINLSPDFKLPDDIQFLLPYRNDETISIIRSFYGKFYHDNNPRVFIIGINPGRFGAGITGIAFTDPVMLEKECAIKNTLGKKHELSSIFIYSMINKFGGVELFYKNFFLTAVCPVGFVKHNKNLNYYDDQQLLHASSKYITETLKEQIRFGAYRDKAFCLGEGKNFRYLQKINHENKFFDEIIPLAHPRFIMQYKRKSMEYYERKYIEEFNKVMVK